MTHWLNEYLPFGTVISSVTFLPVAPPSRVYPKYNANPVLTLQRPHSEKSIRVALNNQWHGYTNSTVWLGIAQLQSLCEYQPVIVKEAIIISNGKLPGSMFTFTECDIQLSIRDFALPLRIFPLFCGQKTPIEDLHLLDDLE